MRTLLAGDWIRISCKEPMMDPSLERERVREGRVVSTFNAIEKDGTDNWIIELRVYPSGWFLWKPLLDGGTFERIEPKVNDKPISNTPRTKNGPG